MKKIIILIIVLIGSFNVFSLDHGMITGFESGYNIYNIIATHNRNDSTIVDLNNSISLKMIIGYRIEGLRFVGTYTNMLDYIAPDSFNPLQDIFKIDVNYTFKAFKVGFSHYCSHPVIGLHDNRASIRHDRFRSIYISFYKEY